MARAIPETKGEYDFAHSGKSFNPRVPIPA